MLARTHFVRNDSPGAVLRRAMPDARVVVIVEEFAEGRARAEPDTDARTWLDHRAAWWATQRGAYADAWPEIHRQNTTALAAGLDSAHEHAAQIWVGDNAQDQLFLGWLATLLTDALGADTPIFAATPAAHIGTLPDATAVLASPVRPIEDTERTAVMSTWRAFTAASPEAFAREALASKADTLRDKLWRLLLRFPSAQNGLAHWEQLILESRAARDDVRTARTIGGVLGESKSSGDAIGSIPLFELCLDLARQGILIQSGGGEHMHDTQFRLTPLARDILAGNIHRFDAVGFDRWIGGTHVRSDGDAWVWDGEEVRRR